MRGSPVKMNVCLSFPHPSTFNPLLCTSKTQLLHLHSNSTTILFSFSFPFHSVHRIPQLDKKRRRFVTWASSLQLPLLPFPIDQVNITFIYFSHLGSLFSSLLGRFSFEFSPFSIFTLSIPTGLILFFY